MKIKTSLFYSLAAATVLGGVANAQNSATDPVGFHTITVKGAPVDGTRISLVSGGLINPIDYASGTTAIDATTITVDGTPFAGTDYGQVAADPGVPPLGAAAYTPYYVEVTSGPEEGAWANIVSNTDNVLTVDRDLSAAGAEKIAIRRHTTISDLFGAANEAGLDSDSTGTGNLDEADEVILFDGTESTILFYIDGGGITGWFNSELARAENQQIEPQQGVQVNRKVAGDVVFTKAGHVKVGKTLLNVNPGVNVLANPRAVGIDDTMAPVFTLGTSNLRNTADPANSVTAGDQAANADEVQIFGTGPEFSTTVYFYAFIDGVVDGWFDSELNPADDVVIDNGISFLLERKADLGGGAFVWCVPAEDIAAP